MPGVSWTMATRWPTRRLNIVDLPTLGRPTTATSGSAMVVPPVFRCSGVQVFGRLFAGLRGPGRLIRLLVGPSEGMPVGMSVVLCLIITVPAEEFRLNVAPAELDSGKEGLDLSEADAAGVPHGGVGSAARDSKADDIRGREPAAEGGEDARDQGVAAAEGI